MSDIVFQKILWHNKDNHDKVWCSFAVEGRMYCGWGRRGAKMQFKDHGVQGVIAQMKLRRLEIQKQDKGYKEVDKFLLFSLFPDFEDTVEQELLMKVMSGKVR